MRLEYVGSAGTIDLRNYNTCIYKANFHAYEWGYSGTEKALGVVIDQFTKQPLQYEMTVAVRGSEADKKAGKRVIAVGTTSCRVLESATGKWYNSYNECDG